MKIEKQDNGYEDMLSKLNLTREELQRLTEIGEVIEFQNNMYYKSESSVDGLGVFAMRDILQHEMIGLGTIDSIIKTTLGRYTNHSDKNNANFFVLRNGDLIMIAMDNISKDSEIFIDYTHHYKPNEDVSRI
jgi:hypothetical protein|tara:strand:- start:14029 stop:14424 length:396 start_codon:yes stop_codon:yes gene_type:complete